MRILFLSDTPAAGAFQPRLADNQVNCCPSLQNDGLLGRVQSLNIPTGTYDVASVIARLPLIQAPAVIVCLLDSRWRSMPTNLGAFRWPKVLLIADSHLPGGNLQRTLDYIRQEQFDRIVFVSARHHLELFRSAGVQNLFWFPGLLFPHSDAAVRACQEEVRQASVAIVGQSNDLPRRQLEAAERLTKEKIAVGLQTRPPGHGLRLYGSSLAALNVSLNGELGLGAFEALASGSMLLMDQTSPDSGIAGLWKEGTEFVGYRGLPDLVDKARHYLAHPDQARAIGAAGSAWFAAHLSAKRRREAFARLVSDGVSLPEFSVPETSGNPARWLKTLVPFDELQQVHAVQDAVRVVVNANVPIDLEKSLGILPRVETKRVHLQGPAFADQRADLIVTGKATIWSQRVSPAKRLWIWDAEPADTPRLTGALATAGLRPSDPGSNAWIQNSSGGSPADELVAAARLRLEAGESAEAFKLAYEASRKGRPSAESLLIMAEAFLDAQGTADDHDFRRMLEWVEHRPTRSAAAAASRTHSRGGR